MPFFASLFAKPFVQSIGKFLTSWPFIIGVVALVLLYHASSVVNDYIQHEVSQQVQISEQKSEIKGLENQVEVLKVNQQIVEKVTKETRIIQEAQQVKSKKIEDKINEEVQNGSDGFAGSIITNVIDSL